MLGWTIVRASQYTGRMTPRLRIRSWWIESSLMASSRAGVVSQVYTGHGAPVTPV